jgi:hypothetical protein
MLRLLALCAIAASVAAGRQWKTRTGAAPPPVAAFEPLRYIGRWFQMYGVRDRLARRGAALCGRSYRPSPPPSTAPPHRTLFPPRQDLTGEFYESRYCVVADYGVFSNSTVSVRNRERKGSVTGAETDILGWCVARRGARGAPPRARPSPP